jgi:branched-chain amino acid transport system permease protein
VLLERVVIRPILGQPAFSIVMLTIGIGYMARGLITMIPASAPRPTRCPCPTRTRSGTLGGWCSTSSSGGDRRHRRAVRGLYALFRYSKLGIAMQASSQNQLAAYYMGIPVKRLNGLVWGLAAAVAAMAGLLLAPITFVHANMGFIGLKAFPAAVVGGFGSLPGAIVGGLIIGIVESLSGFYLPEGFKDIARLHRGADHADGQAQRPVRREAAQEGLRCASSSRPRLRAGHRLAKHGGQVFWYGAAAAALLAPRPGCCPSTGWRS